MENQGNVVEFKKISFFAKQKLTIEQLCDYERNLRKFKLYSQEKVKWIKTRAAIHPIINFLIKSRRIINKQSLTVFNQIPNNIERPIIYSITHTGKYDIEIVNEVIKKAYYLLSDDEEYMYRTLDGFITYLNGVVYVDSDFSDDKKVAKETMIKILKQKGSIMWFPEGIWNLSPNQLMLPCPYGIIEVAYLTNATIVPIALEQKDKDFYVNIGSPLICKDLNFDDMNSKTQKIEAINKLRDIMATLKWEIWEKFPIEQRKNIPSNYYEKFVEQKISEWPYFTEEAINKRIYKPKNIVTYSEVFEPISNLSKKKK